tara:strand:- start:31 stop:603 length:573 start_codon:yes stop_codon:yes gene_type:complete
MIFRAVAIICGLVFSISPAFSAESDGSTITVSDSLKDTEILLAKILKDRLKVNGTLTIRGDNSEDLVLQIRFNGNAEMNLPEINAVIDTRIVGRDKDGKAISQVISIASSANLKFSPDRNLDQLTWVNKWNSRTVPLILYVQNDRIVASYKLLITTQEPMTAGQFALNFTNVVRSWPALIKDLQSSGLVE